MAHMDRKITAYVWGIREEPNSKRTQKEISNNVEKYREADGR